jgi:glycosidase
MKLPAAAIAIAALLWAPLASAAPEIVYQVFVRSFRDANGDRVGDLDGLSQSAPYLKSLGVTSILLTPIQPSPFYHSYFASRFAGVDPAYGDMARFRHLVRVLHGAGMKLYLDEEFQYVAEGHPWLTAAVRDPRSPEARRLLLSKAPATTLEPMFPGLTRLPTWDGRQIEVATVDLKAPGARAYFTRYLLSWAAQGVDGFRIDHMMDDLDNKGRETDLFASFWRPMFARLRAAHPKLRIIAEQADWGYGEVWLTRGGVDAVFAFPLRAAIARLDKAAVEAAIAKTAASTPPGKVQLIQLENHDTDRFASAVGGDPAKLRLGAAFDLFLKGTPLIYYGQELGMRGKKSATWNSDANDIPQREAFRWGADLDAPGSAIWYAGDHPWWTGRYNGSNDGVSVAEEDRDPGSLLNWYRRLTRLRRERPEWASGDQVLLCAPVDHVVCILRTAGRARSLMIANLAPGPVTLTLSQVDPASAWLGWTTLARNVASVAGGSVSLGPYGVAILGEGGAP